MISLVFYLSTRKIDSLLLVWAANWDVGLCDLCLAGWNTSWTSLSRPPQQEVLFPLSSPSPQSSQKLSPGVSPAFPPSFSSQTSSCKSKWKPSCFIHSQLLRKCLHALLLCFPGLSTWDSGSCCTEQFTSFPSLWPLHLVRSVFPAPWLPLSLSVMWRATLAAHYTYQQHCHVALLWYFHLWGFPKTWQAVFPCMCMACFFKSWSSLLFLIS